MGFNFIKSFLIYDMSIQKMTTICIPHFIPLREGRKGSYFLDDLGNIDHSGKYGERTAYNLEEQK